MDTSTPETPANPEEVKAVENLLQQVVKTVKTLKLYRLTNPITQRFLKGLHDQFADHLNEHGLLTLQVQQYELLYDGHVAYREANRRESLALKFFLDGIAELTFHEGLEEEELTRFLEFLVREYEPDNADDDLVTLLWGAHFSHIGFRVAEAYLEEPPPITLSSLARSQPNLKRVVQAEAESAPSAADLPQRYGQESGLELFQISGEELSKLKAEVEIEGRSYTTARLVEMLTAILEIERDDDAFREPMEIMDRVLATLMQNGDWADAARILGAFRGLERKADLSEAQRRRLAESIDQAGSGDRMKVIGGILEKGGEKAAEDLPSVLTLLNRNALLPLCELLGRLESTAPRMVISEVLVGLGKEASEVLASKLTDERWTLVRDLVSVLGRIADPRVIDGFRRLVRHARVEVRKEVIHAARHMNEPRARDLLAFFLKDADEGVRVSAAKALAQASHQAARQPLLELIQSKECKEKSLYEKTWLFEALGRIGGEEAIPALEGILKKRSGFLLRDAKQSEMGICAALALRRIGSRRAIAVLEEGSTLGDKAIRGACATALEEMREEKGEGR